MCQIISVAVHPTTLEVFSSPGSWSHSEICHKVGIPQDQVFCPEIVLESPKVIFTDGPIAVKRQVPAEMLQELLAKYDIANEDDRNVLCELRITHEWTKRHEEATMQWFQKNAGSAKKLIGYSQHTFEPQQFALTLHPTSPEANKARGVLRQTSIISSFADATKHERLNVAARTLWQRTFEQPENRVPAWRLR